jgi:hypothetical protein
MKVIQIQLDPFGCGNKIYIVNNFLLLIKEINIFYIKNLMLYYHITVRLLLESLSVLMAKII